jgi:hypothetical protein
VYREPLNRRKFSSQAVACGTLGSVHKTTAIAPQARWARPAAAAAFRRDIGALHAYIYRQNQARINASVTGYTAAFRRYERTYRADVQTFMRRCSLQALDRKIARARLVYVGDYHTLPRAQRAFLHLLERLGPSRPVVLALEFIQGKHQPALDAYMVGTLAEAAFTAAIGHHKHWSFNAWPNFAPILQLARARGYKVVGIDSMAGAGAKDSLAARDRYAAKRIVGALQAEPAAQVFVLCGELHIAPAHLPAQVAAQWQAQTTGQKPVQTKAGRTEARRPLRTKAAQRRRTASSTPASRSEPPAVIIYQNCQPLYQQLQARGHQHDTAAVQLSANRFCLMNTPPIVCQQSFLNWLYAAEDGEPLAAPEEAFRSYVKVITNFFELPIKALGDDVELTSVVDLSFLARLQRRGDFTARDMQLICAQIKSSESYYIPRAKMIYLGNLSVNHVSEEATHYLRHSSAQLQEPKLLMDAFYARCIEEALGFLGSKIINPKRRRATVKSFQALRRSRDATEEQRTLATLVLRHARMESGAKVRDMAQVYDCSANLFNQVTHALGYRLGDRLYYGLLQGKISKDEIRDLFAETFEESGAAFTAYLFLLACTSTVRLPTTK